MSKTLTTLLVGAHFRPPAKFLLAALPSGTKLLLVPEPENPYDASAVKVLLPHSPELDERAEQIEAGLQGTGFSYLDLDELWPIQLGYLAAAGNKQLAKQQAEGRQYSCNSAILEALGRQVHAGGMAGDEGIVADSERNWLAKLGFGPDGSPLVVVEVPT